MYPALLLAVFSIRSFLKNTLTNNLFMKNKLQNYMGKKWTKHFPMNAKSNQVNAADKLNNSHFLEWDKKSATGSATQ